MEENKNIPNIEEEQKNFKDFDEENMDNIKEELEQMQKETSKDTDETSSEENLKESQTQEEPKSIEEIEEAIEELEEEAENKPDEDISKWEELNSNNDVVKKYIVYISKDFVPYIDSLTVDERSAYINDAIQTKLDLEDIKKQKQKKIKLTIHLIITIITICFMTPIALLGVHKAIMMTFENYKYSQENFEKLYKQRFEKDKAYMRSVQYNKEMEKKNKK